MGALERFEADVAGDQLTTVDEAALLMAAHLDDDVNPDRARERLQRLADSVREPTLDGVRRRLFDELGFAGDRVTYYDPKNSLLPAVIERRRGIPVTLAVLTMGVARRLGVPVDGIGLPGHFLLRDRVDHGVFIDVFAGGIELDRRDCEARFREIHGPDAAFDEAWLEPVPGRAILARMLGNLRAIHARSGDRAAQARVLELLACLPATGRRVQRELASTLAALGRFDEAAAIHEQLAEFGGDGDDRTRAASLRARLN